MAENQFDLTKLITDSTVEKKQYKSDIISLEEKKQLLVGYELLPSNKWLQIFPGSHIRYQRKDGLFRKGGYVKFVDQNKESFYISTVPIDTRNSNGWRLLLNSVAQIWVISTHGPSSQSAPTIASNDLYEELASAKDDIRQLKLEIQRVTDQQKRIINLIGKTVHRNRGQ